MSTTTRLLQRQILPLDRDTDVFPLYVDLEEAKLDTDRDIYMTADEAKEYGLVDELLSKPEGR